MKFRVTLKDPDVLYDSIENAVEEELKEIDYEITEKETLSDIRRQEIIVMTSAWFKYGEYTTIEIDTDDNSCRVVPVSELNN